MVEALLAVCRSHVPLAVVSGDEDDFAEIGVGFDDGVGGGGLVEGILRVYGGA